MLKKDGSRKQLGSPITDSRSSFSSRIAATEGLSYLLLKPFEHFEEAWVGYENGRPEKVVLQSVQEKIYQS